MDASAWGLVFVAVTFSLSATATWATLRHKTTRQDNLQTVDELTQCLRERAALIQRLELIEGQK